MTNAFFAMALRHLGRAAAADEVRAAIQEANRDRRGGGLRPFPEFLSASTGRGGGTWPQAWSAAAEILAGAAPEVILPESPGFLCRDARQDLIGG